MINTKKTIKELLKEVSKERMFLENIIKEEGYFLFKSYKNMYKHLKLVK